MRTFLLLVVSMLAFKSHLGASSPIVLKVGITEYQNLTAVYESYARFFQDVTKASNGELRFKIAVGNYDEVLKWRDHDDIDLAVLSASPLARVLALGNSRDRKELAQTFLGHLIYFSPPQQDRTWVLNLFEDRSITPRFDGYYRSTCVVPAQSRFHSLQDIVKAANDPDSHVKLLFVRPYSVSGYIHPRYILERAGLVKSAGQKSSFSVEFTMQHGISLDYMLNPSKHGIGAKEELVAFVLDQTEYPSKSQNALRRIPIPELENVSIPQEALFLSSRYSPDRERVSSLLATALQQLGRSPKRTCDRLRSMCFDATMSSDQWLRSYRPIIEEARTIPLPATLGFHASISDLATEFNIYRERYERGKQNAEPRLALVLSGGGAKCAYQAGALKAIREEMKELGKSAPEFHLVVGTSGGAINALFYALGLENQLDGMWTAFDQSDLIKPAYVTVWCWGILVGLITVLVASGVSVILCQLLKNVRRWADLAGALISIVCVAAILASRIQISSLRNHWWYHDLLLLKLALVPAVLGMLASVAIMRKRTVREAVVLHRLTASLISIVVLTLTVLLLLGDVLLFDESLSDLSGAKYALVSKLPEFLSSRGDLPEPIRSIDIVDGGFSHNSPLDAAISWGATHVVLIEASPHPVYEHPTMLLSHGANAFNYLFDQAQRSDSRVRGNVEIYELSPSFKCDEWFDANCSDARGQWLDLVDFSSPLLKDAMNHGEGDVKNNRFIRIPGPPRFVDVLYDVAK